MSQPVVTLDIEGHVARVTLDRPEAGNRVDGRLAAELADACTRIEQNPKVRVAVLTGAGAAFCLGTDDRAFQAGTLSAETMVRFRVAGRLGAVAKPVVAAVNGDAIDQGLELALACDLRVATVQARLGLTHVSRGHIPWDGGTQRLPRLVGPGPAAELILTSRLIDVVEARRIGLITEAVESGDALHRAMEVAEGIARHGPIAVRYVKEAVLEGQDLTIEQGLRLEADLSFLLQGTADRAEGIQSFIERREPEYRDE